MSRLIVFGYGYLGNALGRALETEPNRYERVIATVRSPERATNGGPENLSIRRFELDDWSSGSLREMAGDGPVDIAFMIPPSRIAGVERKIGALAGVCSLFNVSSAVLISSTGVYGKPAGIDVSAESEPRPDDNRSAGLAAIEAAWQRGGSEFRILRLAGLYGPGRVIGRAAVEAGRPVGGDPEAWLNLIHVDDAAALVLRCLARQRAAVELGADGSPTRRGDYYRHLAALLNAPEVSFEGASARNVASKRCRPDSTFERLDWRPRYPNFRAGLAHALQASPR